VADADPDAGACTSPDFAGAPLGVRCNALVDEAGRTVLLHGVNARIQGIFDVTFDDGRMPLEPIPAFTIDDARRIRALGFNALRLPLSWSALEPTETGGFVESYLDRVAAITAACKDAGVLVLLDVHQDAYSKEIGEDGAPLWAISPPPSQKLGGPLTDLGARRLSTDVAAAFGTFFGASAKGDELRARFSKMAAHVAARFASDPAVLGLELYNEPVATDAQLASFHKQVLTAVRAVAPKKLVLWEPPATRNLTDRASLGSGALGAGTVYAPHVYTYSFTLPADAGASVTRDSLRRSNENARMEADSFGAPLVITEWGFDPASTIFGNYVRWQQELQDEQRASAFFWVWKEDSQGSWGLFDFASGASKERANVIAALSRVRLEAIAGSLVSVSYDADARRFQADFVGDDAVTAPNLVSVGATPGLAQPHATCDGHDVAVMAGEPLQIACGGAGTHRIVLTAP
jgi:endoglycosylceramidase